MKIKIHKLTVFSKTLDKIIISISIIKGTLKVKSSSIQLEQVQKDLPKWKLFINRTYHFKIQKLIINKLPKINSLIVNHKNTNKLNTHQEKSIIHN